jgi:hypothetical protein
MCDYYNRNLVPTANRTGRSQATSHAPFFLLYFYGTWKGKDIMLIMLMFLRALQCGNFGKLISMYFTFCAQLHAYRSSNLCTAYSP